MKACVLCIIVTSGGLLGVCSLFSEEKMTVNHSGNGNNDRKTENKIPRKLMAAA